MYNDKDTQFIGRHDYDRYSAERFAQSCIRFSVNIFKWVAKSRGKGMKRSPCVIRVIGLSSDAENVFEQCDNLIERLDRGETFKSKTITVKPEKENNLLI